MPSPATRFFLVALLLPALAACSREDPDASTASGAAQRIIAKESADARARSDDKGIELAIGNAQVHAAVAMSMGLRTLDEGELQVSVSATRIEGQTGVESEVVIARLRPRDRTQQLGDGSGTLPYIELTGVPGHGDAVLRSITGALDVAAIRGAGDGLPPAIDATFSGRFATPTDADAATAAPSPPVDISGRLRYSND